PEPCVTACVGWRAPLAQWAWQYNVRTGAVVDRYPVYSVHQHGMGPMALNAVAAVTSRDVGDAIARSLGWVLGENELGRSMLDTERGVIWRSIRRHLAHGNLVHAFKFLSLLRRDDARRRLGAAVDLPGQLEVDPECRRYELGWLLLALAPRGRACR